MQIEIQSLGKRIKGVDVLREISLSFVGGRIYGLQGKNGSGKTMLLRAIAGLIRPTAGSVSVDGKLLGKDVSYPESVGILIENPSFIPGYTGLRNLRYIAGIKKAIGDRDIEKTLKRVGLDPLDKRTFRKYSLGMKQRLGVACAIMERPSLVLLDEPTNALDPEGVSLVKRALMEERERGALIVIACHDREELDELAEEIFTMAEGGIVKHELVDGHQINA